MPITLVAVLCHALNGVPLCVDEVVSTKLFVQTPRMCALQESIITAWKAKSAYQKWEVQGWKCIPGEYVSLHRA